MLLAILVSSALGGTVFDACDTEAMKVSFDLADTCDTAVENATNEHQVWDALGRRECAALGGSYWTVLPQHQPAPDTCDHRGTHVVEAHAKCVCDSESWSETIDGCGDDIFILVHWSGPSCDVIEPAANEYVEARKDAADWQCDLFGGQMEWAENRYSLGCQQEARSDYRYITGWFGTCVCPGDTSDEDLPMSPRDDLEPDPNDLDDLIEPDPIDETEPDFEWDMGRR